MLTEYAGRSAGLDRAKARALAADPDLAGVRGIGGSHADRAKARALAADPDLAGVRGIGGSHADRAKARALAADPDLAGVRNPCRAPANFHADFRLVLLHNRLQQHSATSGVR
jgi:hypothetical protein